MNVVRKDTTHHSERIQYHGISKTHFAISCRVMGLGYDDSIISRTFSSLSSGFWSSTEKYKRSIKSITLTKLLPHKKLQWHWEGNIWQVYYRYVALYGRWGTQGREGAREDHQITQTHSSSGDKNHRLLLDVLRKIRKNNKTSIAYEGKSKN